MDYFGYLDLFLDVIDAIFVTNNGFTSVITKRVQFYLQWPPLLSLKLHHPIGGWLPLCRNSVYKRTQGIT